MRVQQRLQTHTYIIHFQERATAMSENILSFLHLQVGDNKCVLMFVRIKVNKICKRLRTLGSLLFFLSAFPSNFTCFTSSDACSYLHRFFSPRGTVLVRCHPPPKKNPGFQCPITTNIFLACGSAGNFSLRGLQIGWSQLFQATIGSGFFWISLVVGPKLSSRSYIIIFFSWKSKRQVKTHDA